jgi:hypothetical protein
MTAAPPRGRTRGVAALALLAYAALAVAFLAHAWFSSPTALVDGSGDPQQAVWFLSWVPWAVGHGHNPFFTQHLNAPVGVNLMWNSLAPLLGLALWPITATAGAVVAYDLLVTADLALSAWCAFLLLRRWVDRPLAAFAGGLLYGFSPFLTTQAPSHSKIAFALLPPLLLLLVDDVVVRHRASARRGGLWLGVLLAAQLLVYEEGFILALVAGAVVLAVLAVRAGGAETRRRLPHVARALGWALIPLVLIAAIPLGYQLFGPQRTTATVPGASVYVTDVANLVVPTATQWLSPTWAQSLASRYSGNSVESGAYLGIPVLAMMLWALLRSRRRALVVSAAACAVVLAVLSLGPQLHVGGHTSRLPLPWRVIAALPVVGSALPSRLFVYVDLAAAVLVAVFVDEVVLRPLSLDSRARVRQRLAAAAAVAAAPLTLVPHLAGAAQLDVPRFFTDSVGVLVPAESTALVAPYSHDGLSALPMAWQASADMAFRMPEGYFVSVDAHGVRRDGPPRTATADAMLRIQSGADPGGPLDLSAIRADLRRWQVRTVLVGPMPHQDRMLAFFTRVLATRPVLRGGVWIWTDVQIVASARTGR